MSVREARQNALEATDTKVDASHEKSLIRAMDSLDYDKLALLVKEGKEQYEDNGNK